MLNQVDFEKLQKTQLEIMDEVHRVCLENNLNYYIIGGTALGAKRHNGFIPWDLDIDIAMPRYDYEKFAEICKKEFNERFFYCSYKEYDYHLSPHALVYIKNTCLINKFDKYNSIPKHFEIYLDIFPLDNAPDDIKLREKQAKRLKMIKELKKIKVCYMHNNKFIVKLIKKILQKLLFFISLKKINERQSLIMQTYNNCDTECLCSMGSHYSYKKQCMPRETYGKPMLIQFGGRKYYGPENIDEYLSRIYGDYMKLPPVEQRQANLKIFEKVILGK